MPSSNPTPATYTVSFTGNGVSIKAQTVKAGGYATKPADPFWDGGVFVEWQLNGEAFDFENTPITADKEIVLTAVAKSAYSKDGKANQTEQGLNSNMTADVVDKYQYSTDGSAKPYGTIFHKAGQKLTFTADFAGDLSMYFNVDKTARRFVLDITVDGAAYATVILDTTEKTIGGWSVLCNLPAGVHTVTITVTEASGDGLAAWSGLNIASLRIISKAE